jgi:hypothetical protein
MTNKGEKERLNENVQVKKTRTEKKQRELTIQTKTSAGTSIILNE